MLQIYSHPYSPIQENSYIVYNENKEAIIIDPGCYDDAEKEHFAKFITDNNLTVKHLLLTHCHLDHVFGLAWAAQKYKLIPQYHPLEVDVLEAAAVSGLMYSLPFVNYDGAYNALYEGLQIKLGNDILTLMHLPGHTQGSIGFYCAAQKFVIAGDVLFYESIGRTDLPGGNMDTLISTIKQKLFKLPAETKVYNGHGKPTTIGHEIKHNPFLK